jgi:hypothetical protein
VTIHLRLVCLVLLVILPLGASEKRRDCRWLEITGVGKQQASWISPKLRQRLGKIRRREILAAERKFQATQEKVRRIAGKGLFPDIGEDLLVLGKSYRVLGVLGEGDEGIVYVVQAPWGMALIKHFRGVEMMEGNLAEIKRQKKDKIPFATPIAKDIDQRNLLLEYVEAIPLEPILSNKYKLLLPDEVSLVRKKLEQFLAKHTTANKTTRNIVLNLGTGELKVNDPR